MVVNKWDSFIHPCMTRPMADSGSLLQGLAIDYERHIINLIGRLAEVFITQAFTACSLVDLHVGHYQGF